MALHAMAFVALVLLAVAEILISSLRPEAESPPPPDEVVVELSSDIMMVMRGALPPVVPVPATGNGLAATPTILEAPEPSPVEEVVAEPVPERGFLDTTAEQASEEAPVAATLIGERNTRAASEEPADPEGPAVPTQEGEEQLRNELNLFDSDFNDGEEPDDQAAAVAEEERSKGTPDAVAEEARDLAAATPEPSTREESGVPREPLLDSANEVPVPATEGKTVERKEETLPQGKPNESEARAARQGEEGLAENLRDEPAKKNGFRTEARKTRIRGSLSRKGRSALDVENTALGRYRAKVYRVIEREWQQQCITYRNHILPGSLTLRFFVDERGEVSGLRYIYEFQTSEIQKGFSVMSVRRAKIPPMPAEVADELDGELMECELDLNFRF